MAEPTTEVAAFLAELADIRAQQRGLALEKGRLLAELQALLHPLRHAPCPAPCWPNRKPGAATRGHGDAVPAPERCAGQ